MRKAQPTALQAATNAGRLTDAVIAAAFAPSASYKALADGRRLFLMHKPDDSKHWRLKFKQPDSGKDSMKSFGVYPDVSIADARAKAEAFRESLRTGIDPVKVERETKIKIAEAKALTFERVGLEWLERNDALAKRTRDKHRWLFGLLKPLHALPIGEIKTAHIYNALRAIEAADDRRETAHRAGQVAAAIFRYARVPYGLETNPALDRKEWLKPVKTTNRAALVDPKRVGVMVDMIDQGGWSNRLPTVENALKFLVRVFVRQAELCGAKWSEFHDLDSPGKAEWRIPAERMKMKRPFIVPLSTQAVAILKEQRAISGAGHYVFPHAMRRDRHMSNGALGAALGAMGYKGEQQPHGFRTTAATLLREALRFDSELVELQLAHSKRDKVAAAYDRAQRMDERHAMMQKYSDYLEGLKS